MSNYNFATHFEYLITEQNLSRIRVSEQNFGQNKRSSLPKSVPLDFGLEKTFALYFYHQHYYPS